MLAADQEFLESQMKKQAVAIQNLELKFYVSNFDTAATCASLLAGFAYAGLQRSDFDGLLSHWQVIVFAYYSSVAIAFGANFLCFILAILCRIQGVRLALKGPQGAMKVAVDTMRVYQEWALSLLELGLFAFHASALALALVELGNWFIIFTSVIILLWSAGLTVWFIRITKRSFAIPEGREFASSITSERIIQGMQQHTYQEMQLQRLSGAAAEGVRGTPQNATAARGDSFQHSPSNRVSGSAGNGAHNGYSAINSSREAPFEGTGGTSQNQEIQRILTSHQNQLYNAPTSPQEDGNDTMTEVFS